jgi:hypothetical protein
VIPEELRERPRVSREENVARHVGGAHFDDTTGQVNGGAFDRSPKDTDGLSVMRRGVLAIDPPDDEIAIRRVMSSVRKLGATSQFVELNVGRMLDALEEFEQEVFVCEDPIPAEGDALANPAHALVVGLPFAGEAIGSLRSELVGDRLRSLVCHTFPAVLPAG